MKQYQKAGQLLCAVVFTILLGMLCSKKIVLVHDHYCALATFDDVFAYGADFSDLGKPWDLSVLLNGVIYKVFGNTIFTVVLMVIFPLLPCLFCASYLASKDGSRIYWTAFPLLYFLLVPLEGRCDTWINHQWEAFVFLLFLIIVEHFFREGRQKKSFYIGAVYSSLILLYGTLVIGSILVLLYVAVPGFICLIKLFLQRKDADKKLFLKGCLLSGVLLFAMLHISGMLDWVFSGYGGNGYMDWTSIDQLLNNFMLSIKYTAESWGIDYSGKTLLQGWTIVYILKYSFFFYALYLCVKYFIQGMRADTDKVHWIDFLCSLCAICNIGANIIGNCIYSGAERYFSGAHYALAILLCHHFGRLLYDEKILTEKRLQIRQGLVIAVCMAVLAQGMNARVEKLDKVAQLDAQIADYLASHDLEYGMGDFSNIYSFSALSGGQVQGFSCYAQEDKISRHFRIPASYYDTSCRYNYLYDTPHEELWNQELIEKYYGDYIAREEFEGRVIYAYDYDIRWQQVMVDASGKILDEGADMHTVYKIMPSEFVGYTFCLPIGITRLTLYGKNIKELQSRITSDANNVQVVKETMEKDRITYDLSCDETTTVKIKLQNNGRTGIDFKYADLRIVSAGQKLLEDRPVEGKDTVTLPLRTKEKNILITVKADQAKRLELQAEKEQGLRIEKIKDGSRQAVYRITGMTNEGNHDIQIYNRSGQKVKIKQVCFESEDVNKLYAEKFLLRVLKE